jgi:hypothetical protein
MPVVGNRKFPYTPEGEAAASAYSKSVGSPVRKGYAGGGKILSDGEDKIETEGDRVQRRFGDGGARSNHHVFKFSEGKAEAFVGSPESGYRSSQEWKSGPKGTRIVKVDS